MPEITSYKALAMEKYGNLKDEDLAARVMQNDLAAAEQLLLHRCGPSLKYLVQVKYRALGIELNEIVSETYLLLRKNEWRAMEAYRGANQAGRSCSLTHYVLCIAARWLSRKSAKSWKEGSRTVPLEENRGEVTAATRHPAHALMMAEIVDLIMELPDPIDRAVLLLYKIEGNDVNEVAKRLNTSPGNVYTRYSRAVAALRRQTEEASHDRS